MAKRDSQGAPVPPAKAARFLKCLGELSHDECLKSGAVHASGATEEGVRHPFQLEVLKMGGEIIQEAHAAAQEAYQVASAHAATMETELNTTQTAHDASLQRVNEASTMRDEKAAAALHAEELAANALYEHGQTEAGKKKISAEKARLEEEKEQSLPFLNGGWHGMASDTVLDHLNTIGAEPALIAAVPGTLAVSADERAGFDKLVEEGLDQALKDRAEIVDEMLIQKSNAEKEEEYFLLGAGALKDVEAKRAVAASDKVTEAEKTLTELKRASTECKAHVDTQMETVTHSLSAQSDASAKLAELTSAVAEVQEMLHPTVASTTVVGDAVPKQIEEATPLHPNVDSSVAPKHVEPVVRQPALVRGGC